MPVPNYPLDLTAVAPSNHITGEVHVITTAQSRFFVPVAGPFYTQSLILRNNTTNAILLPNADFKILQHHHEASEQTGKNVCAIVYITNPLIGSVNLEYQCVGGVYSDTSDIIRQAIIDHPLDPDQPQTISWGQVFGQPDQFPISAHQHLANQFWGYGDLVAAIEQLRVAVASGDNMAMSAIYRYIELVINDNNYLTADDLNGLLQTPDTFIKVHPTYASLRDRDDFVNALPIVYMTIGQIATNDGHGMMFRWDPTSTAVDDNHHILRPDSVNSGDPGRLISLLWAENTLKPVLNTLGRRIEPDGTINTNIAEISYLINTDLNQVINSKTLWVDSTYANKPNNVSEGMLYVEKANENYVFQLLICGQNVAEVDSRTDKTIHVRIGTRAVNTDPMTWTVWESMLTRTRARLNGIDAFLAATNSLPINGHGDDLDEYTRTGKYWVGATTANKPFTYGVLTIEAVQQDGECHQTMSWAWNEARRSRYYVSPGVYEWTEWIFRANRNGDTNQTFAMYSYPSNTIDPSHGINAWYLATQFASPLYTMLHRHGLDTAIAATHSLLPLEDLDTVLTPGKYWFNDTQPNRPFDYAVLEVELVGGTIAAPVQVHQRAYWDRREAFRSRDYLGNWGGWFFVKNRDLGDDRNINGRDLNTVIEADEYYYTPTCANRPSNYGLLKVWREQPTVVYQLAQSASDGRLYTRYGSDNSGTMVWSAWIRFATFTELQDEATARANADQALSNAIALPTPYYWASLNPGAGGSTQYVTHYCPAGARRLAVAMVAPGGGGGAGGFGSGGSGGGGGAGSFGQMVVEGDLTGCYLVTGQPPDNASGLYPSSGYNSDGHDPYSNPASQATLYDAGGTAILQMTCNAGWTGGGGNTERGGSAYSFPGAAGQNGTTSVWRNPGYSAKILVHSAMTNGVGTNASNGIGNNNGPGGPGGTVDTSARNGYGGNPYGDGNGGQGGDTGVYGPAVNDPGNGATGHTGAAVVRIE